MKQILMIEVSPRGKDSASRAVADTLAARLIDLRSYAATGPPSISLIWTKSRFQLSRRRTRPRRILSM
jgi:hypothetical protein